MQWLAGLCGRWEPSAWQGMVAGEGGVPTAGDLLAQPCAATVCPQAHPRAQLLLQPHAGAGVGQGAPGSLSGGAVPGCWTWG